MPENKRLTNDLYALVYGQYVPRLCVDLVVIGPEDTFRVAISTNLDSVFDVQGPNGIILIQRDIPPEIGSWHLPGGTVRKGETLEVAAKRIIKSETGIEVEILDRIGSLEFLNEEQEVELNGKKEKINIHSVSVILLAKAKTNVLTGSDDGKNVEWFKIAPTIGHTIHIPYLIKHGFLK
ncbi:MAG: NUDIX domain-containing protein [Patescibacteria group bacterium]